MCHASLATDTGGSIRQPAAFCGLVGIKPTYGRVSRYGVVAYASSLDQVGAITHSVADAALIFSIIAGQDTHDATTSMQMVPTFEQIQNTPNYPKKIAILNEIDRQQQALHPEVWQAYTATIASLEAQNHEIIRVNFDYLPYVVPTYYLLTTAESSSNLSRYSGVLYGYRSPAAHNLQQTYALSRTESLGSEVKRRIMLGTYVLSAGFYEAYYTKAQQVRRLIFNQINDIFAKADFILMPVTPTPPFEIGKKNNDPVQMYLEDIFTVTANLAGVAAIAVPAGTTADGLPLSVQILAPRFAEAGMIALAHSLE
jgi:aspartyl-tRNA(Asn)/glutamyl-tRNA(Gln) amidotransferase subunit A